MYLVVVSCISKEAAKCDCIGDAAQVDEENSGDGLDVETLIEVTGDPGKLTLDVQKQTTTESVEHSSLSQQAYCKMLSSISKVSNITVRGYDTVAVKPDTIQSLFV